jgi:hypothetical protein
MLRAMRTLTLPLAMAAAGLLASCGGGTSAPEPIAPPVTVAATPTPVPATTPPPTPAPCEDPCEPPVDNNNPAVRLSIRLYILTDDEGRQVSDWDPEAIGVGWHMTLDATAKDAEGRETNGDRVVRWFIDNPGLVKEGGDHLHQTKLTPLAPGQIEVYAKQDGVVSNRLRFVFVP